MPELPEVETLSVQLQKKITGSVLSQILVFQPAVLRSPIENFGHCLNHQTVHSVLRRGKYVGLSFVSQAALWFHMGMTGRLVWKPADQPKDAHTHVVLEFENHRERLIFQDSRRFGHLFVTGPGITARGTNGFTNLGPEPFDCEPAAFVRSLKRRKAKVKSLLLNQSLLAGIGNIYSDECLHRAGIDPRLAPRRIRRERLAHLLKVIRKTLREAIRCGGSSIDDYVDTFGRKGTFQKHHRVYGREGRPCFTCHTPIKRTRISGRSTFFCFRCQT